MYSAGALIPLEGNRKQFMRQRSGHLPKKRQLAAAASEIPNTQITLGRVGGLLSAE